MSSLACELCLLAFPSQVGAEASGGGERSLIRRGTKAGKSEERASGHQDRSSGAQNAVPGEQARASSAKGCASKDKSSRSSKPGKRKRWKAEEIDPMIAAEDAEMKVNGLHSGDFRRNIHSIDQVLLFLFLLFYRLSIVALVLLLALLCFVFLLCFLPFSVAFPHTLVVAVARERMPNSIVARFVGR